MPASHPTQRNERLDDVQPDVVTPDCSFVLASEITLTKT